MRYSVSDPRYLARFAFLTLVYSIYSYYVMFLSLHLSQVNMETLQQARKQL